MSERGLDDGTATPTEPSKGAASAAPTGTSAPAAPEPLQGRKCEQLIAGARAVILARGFEGASVDDIAREAGISKATMYRYFPDKSALFAAVMQRDCGRQAGLFGCIVTEGRPLADVLRDVARRFLEFMLSDEGLNIYRTVVAEAGRFPEVGRAFYADGPAQSREWLAPVLEAAAARGELSPDDPREAAQHFFALCLVDIHYRRLLGLEPPCDAAKTDALARSAVDAFLKLHRPD